MKTADKISPNKTTSTYDGMARFYLEENPLTQKKRYHHMEKERMKVIFNAIYPKLAIEKTRSEVEDAIEELNQN